MIEEIAKGYVSAICKGGEFAEVVVVNDLIVINMSNTSLATIDMGIGNTECTEFVVASKGADYIQTYELYPKIMGYYDYYVNKCSSLPLVAENNCLRDDPVYEEMLSRKATDGAAFYKVAGFNLYESFLIPVFTGMPNLSKADTIGISIRRETRDTCICKYDIYKAKLKKNYQMYFKILDLNRSMKEEKCYNPYRRY